MLPIGHSSAITDAQFSPDGKRIATAADDAIKIWEVETGYLIREIKAGKYANIISFTKDGKNILTKIGVWNIETGKIVSKFKEELGDAVFTSDDTKIFDVDKDVAYVRDSKTGAVLHKLDGRHYYIAESGGINGVLSSNSTLACTSSAMDSTICIWNVSTGKLLYRFKSKTRIINCLFSKDGQRILSETYDGQLEIWNLNTGKFIITLANSDVWSKRFALFFNENTFKQTNPLANSTLILSKGNNIAFEEYTLGEIAPDGKTIITLSTNDSIFLWDAITGKKIRTFEYPHRGIYRFIFSADSKKVTAIGTTKFAQIWNVETGKWISSLFGEAEQYTSAQFNANGKSVLLKTNNYKYKSWDIATGKLLQNYAGEGKYIDNNITYDHKGETFAGIVRDTIQIWDQLSGKVILKLNKDSAIITNMDYSFNNEDLLVNFEKGMLKVWNIGTGQTKLIITAPDTTVTGPIFSNAIFSPDAKKIFTHQDSTIKIWDATTGKQLFHLQATTNQNVHFSNDGSRFYSYLDNTYFIRIWDSNTGKLLRDSAVYQVIDQKTYALDGTKILTTSADEDPKLYDAKSYQLQAVLKGHNWSITSAAFSKDSKFIVTTSLDETAKIWDANSGKLLHTLTGHTSVVKPAMFASNSKIVLTFTDQSVKLWDVATGNLLLDLQTNENIIDCRFTRNDQLVTVLTNHQILSFNSTTGKQLYTINQYIAAYKIGYQFTDHDKFLITDSYDQADDLPKVKTWDLEKGTLLSKLTFKDAGVDDLELDNEGKIALSRGTLFNAKTANPLFTLKDVNFRYLPNETFSPDSKKVIITFGKTAKVCDILTRKILFTVTIADEEYIKGRRFSADGSKLLIWGAHQFQLYNLENGLLLYTSNKNTGEISSITISPNSKNLLVSYDNGLEKILAIDNGKILGFLKQPSKVGSEIDSAYKYKISINEASICEVRKVNTDELLYKFFAIGDNDYLVIDQYNRYDGTSAARKLLYFTCGTEIISLDQVKDQLWVPNLAERIMKGETINAPKLGELNICGLTPLIEKNEKLKDGFHYEIKPRRGGLGETVLFVNDIEIKRYQPIDLKKVVNGYQLDLTFNELNPYFSANETNEVRLKAYTNKNDVSSRGVTIKNNASTANQMAPKLYAVVVGVSDYKGTDLDLKYAAKDATAISNALGTTARKLLNRGGEERVFIYNINTSADRDLFPEKQAIKNTLAEIGKKATANDILIIFFAGHGVMHDKQQQFYFLTADASSSNATTDPASVGISTRELSEWMKPQQIKAQKRILIFDACNSGQAINDFVTLGEKNQQYIAARNNDANQQAIAIEKLNEKSGLFILSASAPNQSAYEMARYEQGVLTYALLKAIKEQPDILEENKFLNVNKWFLAAEKTVENIAKEGGGKQQPRIVSTTSFNIGLVDNEVRSKIILLQEKPLFSTSSFVNGDPNILDDDLEFSSLLNLTLSDVATNTSTNVITYVLGTNAPDAYYLSGNYRVNGNNVTVKANIKQYKKIKQTIEIKGTKDKLKELADEVINQAIKNITIVK